ncbi:hypothetical protein MPSEU_000536900 [Mayamaea pseudoterrestris]|nr:hypothetical protein MPSEU_000536900 [Mayamaea pseudoterrestris]
MSHVFLKRQKRKNQKSIRWLSRVVMGWQWQLRLIMIAAIVGFLLSATHQTLKISTHLAPKELDVLSILQGSDCEDYGCPIYPLDVASDPFVNASLQRLRNDPSRSMDVPFASKSATTVTRRGNEGHPNQDRSFIINPFITKQTPSHAKSFLIAILDGHGTRGHLVSQYLQNKIPQKLAGKLNSRHCCQNDDWIKQQLIDTFIEADQEGSPNLLTGGSTASVTLRIGSKLYFANCGDSQTILVRHDKNVLDKGNATMATTILYQTRRDKPHLPDERERIERMGGTIFTPQQFSNQSRVIVYSVASLPHEPIGLAMSRSIGDWEWKLFGVTAEPIVDVVSMNELPVVSKDHDDSLFFIIAASDGVWDMRPRREFFAKRFAAAIRSGTEPLWKIAVDSMWAVTPLNPNWYRDDMTLLIMCVM